MTFAEMLTFSLFFTWSYPYSCYTLFSLLHCFLFRFPRLPPLTTLGKHQQGASCGAGASEVQVELRRRGRLHFSEQARGIE